MINRAPDAPEGLWITEVWRSQTDHAASLEADGVRAVIMAARPLIAAMPERIEVAPVGGVGLPHDAAE